jgi:hypothetical protein
MPRDKRNPPGGCRRASEKADLQLWNCLPYSTPPNPLQLDPNPIGDWQSVGPITAKIIVRAHPNLAYGPTGLHFPAMVAAVQRQERHIPAIPERHPSDG